MKNCHQDGMIPKVTVPASGNTDFLHCLANLGRRSKLSAKDHVPKTAGNSKAILVVHEVVLEMVLFQLSPVCGKCFVVEKVVCHIVADVSKDSTAEYGGRGVPIPKEEGVCQLPERGCQSQKQSGRHDQSEPIHWKIVMDTM
jgi:hypothetical protein